MQTNTCFLRWLLGGGGRGQGGQRGGETRCVCFMYM